MLQGILARYHGLTDKWDPSPAGVEQQVCRERIEYGGSTLYGVALHDSPDMEKQVGLVWERDVRPAVRTLLAMKADGSFDALFLAQPGLKAALAQLRGYTGLRLPLRALEAESPR